MVFYDDVFINSGEETDVAIRIQKAGGKTAAVSFKIQPLIGRTLGGGYSRFVRDRLGNIYLTHKINGKI